MEILGIILTVLSYIEVLLVSFVHTECITKLVFDCNICIGNNPLMFPSFEIGLLLAMLVYSRNDVKLICKEALLKIRQPSSTQYETLRNFFAMSIPAIMVFMGRHSVSELLLVIGLKFPLIWKARLIAPYIATFVVAVMMLCYDRKENTDKQMTRRDAAIIGISQLLAFIPGVYRLDISFIAMRSLGFSRAASFRNFILLSIPFQICMCIESATMAWPYVTYLGHMDVLWAGVGGIAILVASLGIMNFADWFLRKFTLLIFALYRMLMVVSFFVYSYPQVVKFMPTTTTETTVIEEESSGNS